jgi:hypothetical protein
MKVLVLSNMNDSHWVHGSGWADILLSCGDVPDRVILGAAESYHCAMAFAIKGDHDVARPFPKPIVDLNLQVRSFAGVRFGGLSGSWKHKSPGRFLYDQWEVDGFLSSFPTVDVFLSHKPPRGIHDRTNGVYYGFNGLYSYIMRAKPKVVIHGQQQACDEFRLQGSRIVGVCGHKLIDV